MSRRRVGPFELVILLAALALVAVGAGGVDQAVRAARADGVPGDFAVTGAACVSHLGHQSCTCLGDYTAADGSVSLTGVSLAGGGDDCAEGAVVAAVDIGARTRVVHPDGSGEWVVTALILAAGAGLGLWAVAPWLRRPRVRTRAS
ncbi:hypothetical protein [Nocardiopsis sp. CC223A]|uniref:hypothetical protein n=1 Tax=Nocardiopsis sp. CC223A TaxID=3044051 RepID=UPI00278BDB56|nr:hypothetical protein [Nocardiopsis sp. CC223A]